MNDLSLSEYPSLRSIPKYGYRACLQCGVPVPLKIKRDSARKKYCSKNCRLKGAIALMQMAAQEIWQENRDAASKVCRICKIEYPQTVQFFSFARRVNGGFTISAYCRPCHNNLATENAEKKWGSLRNKHLMLRYGMDENEFNARMEQQRGLCAICCVRKPVCVDHDHTTNAVRGLLCNGCNAAIGIFNEDADVFQRALEYLGIAVIPVQED